LALAPEKEYFFHGFNHSPGSQNLHELALARPRREKISLYLMQQKMTYIISVFKSFLEFGHHVLAQTNIMHAHRKGDRFEDKTRRPLKGNVGLGVVLKNVIHYEIPMVSALLASLLLQFNPKIRGR
jgi:hypothetical protein